MNSNRCYARISTKNLLYNVDCIRALVGKDCKIIPTIKANAYSHGASGVAKALCDKVDLFGVAEINEAMQLREDGVKKDTLILGYTDPNFANLAADMDFIQSVFDIDYARELNKNLKGEKKLRVHIKINTGMNRFGFSSEDENLYEKILEISKMENIALCGIFSHFAESDNLNSDYTKIQFTKFKKILDTLKEMGIDRGIAHIANSAGVLSHPDTYLDAVRPGIMVYGCYPSEEVKEDYLKRHPEKPLKPVMTLCAKVGQVKKVKKGESVSYSRTFTFDKDAVVATVTAGYADGIPRMLSNKGKVKINGQLFNIVGRVCMDILMVDVTDAKSEIKMGDEVIFWGTEDLPIEFSAQISSTINYELFTGIHQRVTKIYE
ncbi:MAG: alanine racemase [Ruminococcaceae bacterium]|nr:alanine racemase [Oscillospiraceae bacterium]